MNECTAQSEDLFPYIQLWDGTR